VINTTEKIIVAHENDMLHVIIMVSIKEQVRIGNKMLKTINVRTIKASNKNKGSKSIQETCLQSKVEHVLTNASHVLWLA
jgi:hypothetical protein